MFTHSIDSVSMFIELLFVSCDVLLGLSYLKKIKVMYMHKLNIMWKWSDTRFQSKFPLNFIDLVSHCFLFKSSREEVALPQFD